MKPHHKSYWKTIILAAGAGGGLAGLAVLWMWFGGEIPSRLEVASLGSVLYWGGSALLLGPAVLCFAVSVGGLLAVYRDVTQDGRP